MNYNNLCLSLSFISNVFLQYLLTSSVYLWSFHCFILRKYDRSPLSRPITISLPIYRRISKTAAINHPHSSINNISRWNVIRYLSTLLLTSIYSKLPMLSFSIYSNVTDVPSHGITANKK